MSTSKRRELEAGYYFLKRMHPTCGCAFVIIAAYNNEKPNGFGVKYKRHSWGRWMIPGVAGFVWSGDNVNDHNFKDCSGKDWEVLDRVPDY